MSRVRDIANILSVGIAGQNYFINGGMDFWQRGTSFSGSSGSVLNLADRWKSYDISSTSRSTDVPAGQGFQYSISFSAAAGGSYPRLQYRMPSEEAAFLAGKTVTFSFWAKNGAGTASFFSEQQIPTTANSFDGATNNLGGSTFATSGNFSTSWQKYTWTTTVHSTTATNGMTFHLVRDPSSASTTLVTGLKMELGNQATPFTRAGVTLAGELAACQRYYYQTDSYVTGSYSSYNTGNFISSSFNFPVTMRATPSVLVVSDSASNANKMTQYPLGGSAVNNITPPSAVILKTTHWFYEAGGTSNGSQGNGGAFSLRYNASAEL